MFQNGKYQTESLNEFYPMQTGKYIIYQLDSLVYVAFGTRDTTIRYQVKYETDSLIQDNLGRSAYRVFRFIRKNENENWTPDATFMSIATNNQVEFVENNLRFIKLKSPIVNGFSWKGNSFIDTYSANSPVRYLDNWDYTYESVGESQLVGSNTIENCISILQRDEVIGLPDQPDSYSEINYSKEVYAKGIGLVYKKFNHKEYQPNNGGYVAEGSYGITLTMLDHN
ncbi:MAG: hypothetical protein RIR96_771 [Bacteroidota bacterium]